MQAVGSLTRPDAPTQGREELRYTGTLLGPGPADQVTLRTANRGDRTHGRPHHAVDNKQRELLDLLDVQPGSRVLEVGYGPGALIRLLAERFPDAQIRGVDRSHDMQAMVSQHNADATAAGRADLRVGTAEATGLPDESIHHVVSANNVAPWPDLQAGLRDRQRVLRPSGTVLIAWHSRMAPSPITRRLGLPENILDRLRELQKVFGDVPRHDLKHTVAFTAVRPGPDRAG